VDGQENAEHGDEDVADNDEDMPQAEAHNEEQWTEATTEAKSDSVNEHTNSNDSTMDIDSPNINDGPKHAQNMENGYEIHQANGNATNDDHIKVETVESERMLNEESLKVNGVNEGDVGMLTEDGNIQIFEDAKVSNYQTCKS
jgi:hypothetical protein